MERTGIEPVTSGLQILSSADQPWSPRVDVRRFPAAGSLYRMRREAPTMVSLI